MVKADTMGRESLGQALDCRVLGRVSAEPTSLAATVGVDQGELGSERLDVLPPHHHGFESTGVGRDWCWGPGPVGSYRPRSAEIASLKAGSLANGDSDCTIP